MQELKIVVNQTSSVIDTNFEEVKVALVEQMEVYKSLEVTEDNKKERKADIATLRKMDKEISNKCSEVRTECLKPYDVFKKMADELKEIINEPVRLLDSQVKEFEEKQRLAKKEEIKKAYESMIGDLVEDVSLESIYDARWENATVSLKSVKQELKDKIDSINQSVMLLKTMQSDKRQDALDLYFHNFDLPSAISLINRYEQQRKEIEARLEEQRKKEEADKLEAERRRMEAEIRAQLQMEEEIKAIAKEEAKKEIIEEIQAEHEAMSIQHSNIIAHPVAANYKIEATEVELHQIEMYLNSLGVIYERVN